MMRCLLMLLLTCACVTRYAEAQSFYFRHYEVEDGLSNNTVIAALQDRYGFIWLGTSEGLNRFDGNHFKVYRHVPGNPHTLNSNSVYCIYEDAGSRLWVGTEKGIALYDADRDQFSHPILLPDGTVRSICEDADGILWFIFKDELYYYHVKDKRLSKLYIAGTQHVSVVSKHPGGGIWVGSADGRVIYIHNKKARIYRVSHTPQNSIEAICCYKNNRVLVGSSREGLLELNPANSKKEILIRNNAEGQPVFVRNILTNSDTSVFVSTEDGLYIYNPVSKRRQRLHKDPLNPFSLSDNALYALCKDQEGGIWIGSYFGGVNYLPHTEMAFEKYFPTAMPHSLSGNAIREITKDHTGRLWIGSEDGGLTSYNPALKRFTRHTPDKINGLSSTNIHGLLPNGNELLIGTFEHGLEIMNLSTLKVTRHFTEGPGPFDLKSNFVNKIFRTSQGTILTCTSEGLYRFEINRGRFHLLKQLPADAFYSAITEDNSGTIWIGTHNRGLFYISHNDTLAFKIPSDKKNKLEHTRILYLAADTDRHLWVATIDGLFNVDLDRRIYKHYNQDNGLPGNIVYSIIKDSSGNYWIPTSRGLAFLNGNTKKIQIFRQHNGLLNNQFNYQSAFQDTNGQIYLGSIKGLIQFNPASYHLSTYIPRLYITGLQQLSAAPAIAGFENEIPLINRNHIKLAYSQSTFNINYVALNFTDPVDIEYSYKINDGNWYQVGSSKKITFTNLSPGKYHIGVRSTNNHGEWMRNNKTILVEILPPFWKSNSAYILYFVLLLSVVVSALTYYSKRQQEKQRYKMNLFTLQKEKELYQSKMDFFTHITHEIKTPLTLIKLPLERITAALVHMPQLQQYLQIMNSNTERLLQLTYQLLDFRKIETEQYHLFFTSVDLAKLTSDIAGSFAPAMDEKNINFQFNRPPGGIVIAADREALVKIITNLLDNAVKYCHKNIQVSFEVTVSHAKIRIVNDGETVPEEKRTVIFEPFIRHHSKEVGGAGIGLSLVHSLSQLHQATMEYKVINHMNVFTVAFPLIKESADINNPVNNDFQ